MKEQEECGWVWERGKSPGGGTDSGLAQTGAYSRDHSASVSSSPLQRLGGEILWNHTITVNITTLSKHNWTDLDRWEREEEGMGFHCWYKDIGTYSTSFCSVGIQIFSLTSLRWHYKNFVWRTTWLVMHSFYRQHPASHLHGYTNPHMGPAQFNFTLLLLAVELFNWSQHRLRLLLRNKSCYIIYLMILSVIYIISYRVLVLFSGAVCIQSFYWSHFIGFNVKALIVLQSPSAGWCIVQ